MSTDYPQIKPTFVDPDGVEYWVLSNGDELSLREGEIFSVGSSLSEDPDSLEHDALIMLTVSDKARRESNRKKARRV